jgi:hypothetical protein
MAKVIHLPAGEESVRRKDRVARTCDRPAEIVIFPGVRYEYLDKGAASRPAADEREDEQREARRP